MNFVSEDLNNYCIEHSFKPNSVCDEIEAYTRENVALPQMLIGKLEASLLGFIIRTNNSKKVLELGTYTGYSALAMAEHLPEDGELITLDINETTNKVARSFWEKSPHGKKITPMLGQALDILPEIDVTFDLIFIDADKGNYLNYLNILKNKLTDNGIFVIDNCLWGGRVLDPEDNSNQTRGIKAINDFVMNSPDLYASMLPVRDGMCLIRKA
jgi:caffeoyl-CoA O-methyltransferase